MKRSFFLIVPLIVFVASCGTGSEFSGQRFQDGVYYHQAPEPEVRLYSKEDFAYLAAQKSMWQEQDTLKLNLKSLDVPSVNIYIGGSIWWNRPYWCSPYWYDPFWYDPFWYDPFWGPWGSRWSWGWYDPFWYDPWYGPWRPYYPGWYPYGPRPWYPYGPVYPGYYVPVKTRPSSLAGGGNMTGGRITRPGSGATTRPSSSGGRTSYSTRYYTPSNSSGTRGGGSAVSRPGSSGSTGNYSNSRYYGGSSDSGSSRSSSYSSGGQYRSQGSAQTRSQSSSYSSSRSQSQTRSGSYSTPSSGSNTRSYGGGGGYSGGGYSGGGSSGGYSGGGGSRGGGRR